jgi:acyl-CoA synthetase (AMP-forming)/AMP-acid ligase II
MVFNVGGVLAGRAKLEPDRPALLSGNQCFSYRELNERCNRWAQSFLSLGLRKGDRVGLLLMNCAEFSEALFGLIKIGVVPVLLNWRLAASELEYICKDSGLEALIFSVEFEQAVEAIKHISGAKHYVCVGSPAPTWAKDANFISQHASTDPKPVGDEDDPAIMQYSSGTTGRPKGVVQSHKGTFWLCISWLEALDLREGDRILVPVPLMHGFGWMAQLVAVFRGCTIVLVKDFDPIKTLRTIQEQKVNVFLAVPTILHQLAEIPNFDQYLNSVRWVLQAGLISEPLLQKYAEKGIRIGNLYGSGEGGAHTFIGPEKLLEKPGSAGVPLFHNEVRVVDEADRDVPVGQVGEILVKSPTGMKEYWKNPQATKEAVRDGWYHTGDLGRLDKDGYLYIMGRKVEMIRSGGENVYPAEVENVLSANPKILEVAVIGQPDQVWGQLVCAVVRLKERETLTHHELVEFCQGKLAHFKIPKRVIFVDQPLPRNAAGKVILEAMRNLLNASSKEHET